MLDKRFGGFRVWSAMSVTVLLAATQAQAIDWLNGNTAGDFDDGPEWVGGVAPGPTDTVNFPSIGVAATVRYFNINPTTGSMTVDNSDITLRSFSLQQNTHTISGLGDLDVENNGTLTLGTSTNTPLNLVVGDELRINTGGTFNVKFGSDVTGDRLSIATVAGADSAVNIDGAGSIIQNTGSTTLGLFGATGTLNFTNGSTGNSLDGTVSLAPSGFDNSSGIINVTGGSQVTTGSIGAANFTSVGQVGRIVVDGTNSRITQNGAATFTLGSSANSTGELRMTNAGEFVTGTGTTTINATGTVNVTNGTFDVNGPINLNGGNMSVQAFGVFDLGGDQTLTATNESYVLFNQTYDLGDETFVFNSGADLQTIGSLRVGSGGDGKLTVDGIGSLLDVSGTLDTGRGNTTGVTTISNGSIATIDFRLDIARNGTVAGTLGTVNIESDADVTVGPILIGDAVGAQGTGTLNVTGSGTTLMQTGASSTSIGNGGGGNVATMNITNSGVFTSGTGTMRVGLTGTVNVNTGGDLELNGDLDINGGTVRIDDDSSFIWASGKTLDVNVGGTFDLQLVGFYNTPTNAAINVTGSGSTFDATNSTSNGTLRIENGTQLTVTTGGQVTADYFFVPNGTATFDGTGTALDATTGANASFVHRIAEINDTATLRFSNSATGSFESVAPTRLILAGSSNATGLLEVLSGADLTLQSFEINDTGFGSSGIVNLDGFGSTITQEGASTLTVGAAAGGTAELNISGGADYITGTGVTTINTTGAVDVQGSGSLFDVNGDIMLAGGTIDVNSGSFTLEPNHQFDITAGGRFTYDRLYLTPVNATINVTGVGSTFEVMDPVNHDGLMVVLDGTQLAVSAGGEVRADYFRVNDGIATFHGVGSNLDVTTGNSAPIDHSVGAISASGTLRLSNGATGSLATTLPTHLEIGAANNATGLLEVLSDADLTLQDLEINDLGTGTSGIVNVDGGGSTITQVGTSTLDVGFTSGGDAQLNITGGGEFTTGTGLTTINATGTVEVEGSGSELNVNGDIDIVGGTLIRDNATFNLAANKKLTASAGGKVVLEGNHQVINNNTTYEINTGADLTSEDRLLIGNITDGTVLVDGTGSTLMASTVSTSDSGSWVGLNGGTGVATFRNDAQADFVNGNFRIALSGNPLSKGTVNIESGADVTANTILMATTNQAAAVLNVDGAGSTLTLTSGSTFAIGSGGTSSATVNVGNSGVINTKDGTTTLGANGVINVLVNGKFNIGSGPQTVSPNTLEVTSGGRLEGDGVINALVVANTSGVVAPGRLVGTLTINGVFFTETAGGMDATLEIEIDGPGTAGTDYDLLAISSEFIAGEILDFKLDGGYTPALGDEFDFLTAGVNIQNTFDTITNVVQAGNLGLAVRYEFDPNQIDMRVSIRGDTDFDDDVDTLDLTNSIIGFSGAGSGGSSWVEGDFDGDGDTDTADLTAGIINFTGASAANPSVPDLIYDPATGNVTIDADGADVISFSLQSGPFSPADFSGLPAGLTDNITTQIGWTCFNLFSGLTGTANLGEILPTGLTQGQLETALTTASYGLALAGGGGGGRLDIIIPEPASMVLMGMGAVVLVRRKRAACTQSCRAPLIR